MTVLITWILALAPIGIFVLALAIATALDTEVIGAALFFVVATSALFIASLLLLYQFVALFGHAPVNRFARAVLPAQMVAVTTRSSMAPLPLLVTSAEQTLGLPRTVTSFTLPLASFTLRYCQSLKALRHRAIPRRCRIPVEIIGVLIALDLVPDIFKSLTNVTAHLAAVTLVARGAILRPAETMHV